MGDRLGEGYVVRGLLGTGGSSRVYLTENETTGELYAVKEISTAKAHQPRSRTEDKSSTKKSNSASTCVGVLAELRLIEKLYHPALPHVWASWEENGKVYIAMDYVEGTQLSRLLRQRGAVSEEQAVEWGKQLCKALVYLHAFHPSIIYRDMKPANVILQKNGKVKLIDFGAITQKTRRFGWDATPLGTPGYAAPEQYGKRPRCDARTDVYGLGVTLYHMLTGHDPSEPPYRICDIREWNKKLSPSLARIVRRCTAKWPCLRYQNCAALLKALETYHEKDAKKMRQILTFSS